MEDLEDTLMADDFGFNSTGLQRAVDLLHRYLAEKGLPRPAVRAIGSADRLPEQLPASGIGADRALEAIGQEMLGGSSRLGHPGFFAHMDPPTPWLTWAIAMWNAALNQNLLHPDTSAAARTLEQRAIGWLALAFGMDGGHLVPGSTVANLTALWAARELAGVEEVVASTAAHLSIRKAATILNLRFRELPVGPDQRLQPDTLGDLSRAALVLTAGTVAAGVIDRLEAGSPARWRHVDAAWGGALRLTQFKSRLDGIERSDSVAFSPHKWLFQPKECGAVFFRNTAAAHQVLSFGGAYLAAPNIGLLGSHGANATPLVATMLAWGRVGIARRIEHCLGLADQLARLVEAEPRLELFAAPSTGIVLWRPRNADVRDVRARLVDTFVSLATVDGELWLRSVAANPNASASLVVDRVLAAASSRH